MIFVFLALKKNHKNRNRLIIFRKSENIKSVILRSNETDNREDPVIILTVLQPDEYHIISIQFISNAKHIEVKIRFIFFYEFVYFFSFLVLS